MGLLSGIMSCIGKFASMKKEQNKNLSNQIEKELIDTKIFKLVYHYIIREIDLTKFEQEISQLINLKIWDKEKIIESVIGKLRYETYQYVLGKENKERECAKKRTKDFINKWNSEK